MSKQGLPTHDIDHSDLPVRIRPLVHQNSYDFTKEHRHAYYEIIVMLDGGGRQQIDFEEYELTGDSCFLIHPHQVHLLERSPNSSGWVLQFESTAIQDGQLIRLLHENLWLGNSPLLIEKDAQAIEHVLQAVQSMQQPSGRYVADIMRNALQALLYMLLGEATTASKNISETLRTFLKLLDRDFAQQHRVGHYLSAMSVSDKALASVTKQHFGLTPLQVIHKRLILEAQRRLVFDDQSHKAIAFELGFDSASAFSAFVKSKLGKSPSELQRGR